VKLTHLATVLSSWDWVAVCFSHFFSKSRLSNSPKSCWKKKFKPQQSKLSSTPFTPVLWEVHTNCSFPTSFYFQISSLKRTDRQTDGRIGKTRNAAWDGRTLYTLVLLYSPGSVNWCVLYTLTCLLYCARYMHPLLTHTLYALKWLTYSQAVNKDFFYILDFLFRCSTSEHTPDACSRRKVQISSGIKPPKSSEPLSSSRGGHYKYHYF